ncbi:alpha/beta fold hydrolase [Blastopirellula sp. JC732]|uniref:Alpha/beta fold hydrolase n=1 Tax=Blastopirellula sediminis TaxID=2894196 RepID=A0A9X1MQ66_9BACT|nr:alpha/beta fold hydrolase [Blastopirellula sediminis]MCC9605980.1 alpha/beta fold hydrolase [Blastopirellula sediminis]MCC9630721.1 alpha/beta fold hydrolase [Blastopirellula sediminis]
MSRGIDDRDLSASGYRPHPILRGPHLQTIIGAYWKGPTLPYAAVQHQVELGDGDKIIIHDDAPESWRQGDRTALLIHGLGGCHTSPYLVRIAAKLNGLGVRTFRMDLRGCGAGMKLAKKPFHAGCSDDAAAAIRKIHELCPGSPCTAIGFSLGGNVVLKLGGEVGTGVCGGLDSIFSVAPPIDLSYCCENMTRGLNRLYDRDFVRRLIRRVELQKEYDEEAANFRFSQRPRRIVEFDAEYTAPKAGFGSVNEYYEKASSGPLLADIAMPTHILTAGDDPIVPREIFDKYPRSPLVTLEVTSHGGHLGFLAPRNIAADRRWMDWRVASWVADLMQQS